MMISFLYTNKLQGKEKKAEGESRGLKKLKRLVNPLQ